jgi:hypothetical protein
VPRPGVFCKFRHTLRDVTPSSGGSVATVAIVVVAGTETQKPLTKAEGVSPLYWVYPALRCAMALAPEERKLLDQPPLSWLCDFKFGLNRDLSGSTV